MKRVFTFIAVVLLCVLLIGGIFVIARGNSDESTESTQISDSLNDEEESTGSSDEFPDDNSSTSDTQEENSSSGSQEEDSESGSETPPDSSENEEDNPQEEVDYTAYIAEGLTMSPGAAVYLGDDQGTTLRFTGYMSANVKSAVDSGEKEVAFLVAPMDYFDEVNPNNYAYMDWVTEFANAGKTVIYSVLDESNFYTSGNEYMLRFQFQNIMYKNINRKFVCMLVLKTTEGDAVSYQYSAFLDGTDYRSAARSVAYVAAASLNAYALGMENFSTEEVARLKEYINQSVDLANGKTTATDDGSMYAFTTNISAPQYLLVGESFTLTTTVIPDVDIPVWYQSTDESIIRVDENGKVTAIGKGTAVVGVYVAGEAFGITVTVS